MKTPRLLLALTFLTAISVGEEKPVDDAAIRKSFLEQTLSLRKVGEGLSAAALRRELREEKRGVPNLTLPEPLHDPLLPTESYQVNKRATLLIGHVYHDDTKERWHTNIAGGVVITQDGVVVTNYHVLDFDRAAHFAAMDESGTLYPISKVLTSNRKADLAVIQLETESPLTSAPLAMKASVGDSITVVSHPDAHFFTFSGGQISRFSIDPTSRTERVEITAHFARGSSGCGIFDQFGNLIGIVSATNAIYYEEDDRARRNLQMVIHSGVPVASLRELLSDQ